MQKFDCNSHVYLRDRTVHGAVLLQLESWTQERRSNPRTDGCNNVQKYSTHNIELRIKTLPQIKILYEKVKKKKSNRPWNPIGL
jgi:hypothetical protein